MSASSMPHCCCGVTRPTNSPRRPESTAPTCSTRMRVVSPSNPISGRNEAGLALRDVGATSTTERGRSSFAWTTTPNRRPRCSCPWARGIRNSWMSPRSTHALHEGRYLQHFVTVGLVGFECRDLLGERLTLLQPRGAVDDGSPDRFRPAQPGRFKLAQRSERFIVQAQANRHGHTMSVSRYVIQETLPGYRWWFVSGRSSGILGSH